jgi:hypothetical protein
MPESYFPANATKTGTRANLFFENVAQFGVDVQSAIYSDSAERRRQLGSTGEMAFSVILS